MYKILIVEDDETISNHLKEHLEKWEMSAETVVDFHNVMDSFLNYAPDLVVLDISLPFFNGYYWCNEIRKVSNVPIVFLSSHTENMDIVMAMNMGGDDYITKPFSSHILIAKIQAMLRRTYDFQHEVQALSGGGIYLHLNTATVSYKEHTEDLTKNEFKILQLLLEKKNNVVSREDIMKTLWDSDSFIDDNTLTVNVNRLRKKLEYLGALGVIETKKGLGYIIHD